jgi:hypothetical protein
MAVLKSSASSRPFSQLAIVILLLATLSAAAVLWCAARGYTLSYGDAEAHLNIARRVLDSRTPGPEQLGTVWLPLPHLLMMPFIRNDAWWRSGMAGAIPVAVCFVMTGAFLFSAARRLLTSSAAGYTAALLFALNPNMLYLQSTPMTEPVFAACLAALLWATIWYRDSLSAPALLAIAVASNAASLTRYEGWFLIPFVTLYVGIASRKVSHGLAVGALAALGPLAWLAHNQYYYSNALEFYNGEYSPGAIYARQLAQGIAAYPEDHDWRKTFEYYFAAAKLAEGIPLLLCAAAGVIAALVKKAWWPLLFLALPPVFYVWSIHSSGTPLYVPGLWPHSWYNTRYALVALPLASFAAAALVGVMPTRWQLAVAAVLVAGISVSWVWSGAPVVWKESQVNSLARRAWTQQAAAYLAHEYRAGDGIVYSFGDLTGVLREAGIPLREGLHQGNHPAWDAAIARPGLFFHEEWALAVAGDAVAIAARKIPVSRPHYELRKQIIVEGAPMIEIYHLQRAQVP